MIISLNSILEDMIAEDFPDMPPLLMTRKALTGLKIRLCAWGDPDDEILFQQQLELIRMKLIMRNTDAFIESMMES